MVRPTRAERAAGRNKAPTKRARRGAQQIARHDMERGVTSRSRKSIEGLESEPDPRFGGRPGREKSKWRTPRVAAPPKRSRTMARGHRVRVLLPEHLHDKLTRIVKAERKLRRRARFSSADKIVELVRDYQPSAEITAALATRG
ncbi:MAG TPA: hypothetical protein VF902_04185 [Coriobacteriia bacterium]